MQIYVDGSAVRSGNGSKEYPFQTISEAAKIAVPGDEVMVGPGTLPGVCRSSECRNPRGTHRLPFHRKRRSDYQRS